MEITLTIGKKRYTTNMHNPHDISIPIRFDGTSLTAFGAHPASREAYAAEGFVGNVNKGGSCNCDVVTFSPHLHGTHTECVGHISETAIAVCDIVRDSLIPATLVTLTPESGKDSYIPPLRPADKVFTKASLMEALKGRDSEFMEALVIRSLPNALAKLSENYGTESPPFFSLEAMQYLSGLGVKHLLVDIPSIDRPDDEGMLTNHHLFWNVAQGSSAVDEKNPSQRTITELIYVPDSVADGYYLLNLQVAPFVSDASPSRPTLYEITT